MKPETEDSVQPLHDARSRQTARTPWASLLAALTVLALGALWLESGPGLTKRPSRPAFLTRELTGDSAQTAVTVRVASSEARDFQPTTTLQGTTAAARHVTLRSELAGRIVELPVEKGELVAQGAVLARISMGNLEARLREVEAQLKHRVLEYQALTRLHSKGYQAQTKLAEGQARLESSRADLERARKSVTDTRIRAPFAGVLNQREVEIGDYVEAGNPIAHLLDLSTIIVRGRVPERERASLSLGQHASARFLDSTTASGTVRYVSAIADTSTRTFMIEVGFSNPQQRIVAGQSVQLTIPGARVAAHRLPASVLNVDDEGRLAVKLIGDDARVFSQAITMLSQTRKGAWVSGLPARCKVIVVGQESVSAGELVKATDVGPIRSLAR